MSLSVQAAVVDWWLNHQTFTSHSSGAWESKIKVLADGVSGEALSSWLADSPLLAVCSHGRERERTSSLVSSYQGINLIMRTPPS